MHGMVAAAGVAHPFVNRHHQVCPVEGEWTTDIIPKLRNIDVKRLSGGKTGAAAAAAANAAGTGAQEGGAAGAKAARRNDDSAVNAARERYLARKKLKGAK